MKEAFGQAATLAVFGLSVFLLGPWLSQQITWAPVWLVEALNIVISAVVLEFLFVLIAGTPIVRIGWKRTGFPNNLKHMELSHTDMKAGSARYELTVGGEAKWFVSRAILRFVVANDLELLVSAPVAPIYMRAGLSRPILAGRDSVVSDANNDGIRVRITITPKDEPWVWGSVSFGERDEATNHTAGFQHSLTASTKLSRVCAKVLRIRTSTAQLTTY